MKRLEKITISDISDITTVYSPKGRRYQSHNRHGFGLSFCQSGKIVYTINGKDVISDLNHAVILPQYASYRLYGIETGYFPLVNFNASGIPPINDILCIPISNTEFYMHEFSRLKQSKLFGHSRLEAMHILYGILTALSGETERLHPSLAAAIAYIEENYTDPTLSNIRLARDANISEVYLRKLFSEELGTTPKQYIINIRLKKAKQLLCESTDTIGDIAEQCGFTNSYHFCRTFKAAVNMTPTQYRLSAYAATSRFLI